MSLTPLALEADSRTFRIAMTLADAGFRSVVIEGRPSVRRFWDDALEVRSAGGPGRASVASAPRNGPLRGAVGSLREGRFGAIGEAALYVGFRGFDWLQHCHQLARLLPAAEIYYLHSFELPLGCGPARGKTQGERNLRCT